MGFCLVMFVVSIIVLIYNFTLAKINIISETAKFWSSECREKYNFFLSLTKAECGVAMLSRDKIDQGSKKKVEIFQIQIFFEKS